MGTVSEPVSMWIKRIQNLKRDIDPNDGYRKQLTILQMIFQSVCRGSALLLDLIGAYILRETR
jgi:hypothetical protein